MIEIDIRGIQNKHLRQKLTDIHKRFNVIEGNKEVVEPPPLDDSKI